MNNNNNNNNNDNINNDNENNIYLKSNNGNTSNNHSNKSFSNDSSDKSYHWSYVLLLQAFLKLDFYNWVNEVTELKNFSSLPNLFQVDGLINEMLFGPKFLFVKGISKAICDLVS